MPTIPSIESAELKMTLNFDEAIAPAIETDVIDEPLVFEGMTFLKKVTGSYTPANDAKVAYQFGSSQNNPQLILIRSDAQANILIQNTPTGANMVFIPMNKLLLLSLVPMASDTINSIIIDGEASGGGIRTPMPQGVEINYSIYVSDGSLA